MTGQAAAEALAADGVSTSPAEPSIDRLIAIEVAARAWSVARSAWVEQINERSRRALIRAGDRLAALIAKPVVALPSAPRPEQSLDALRALSDAAAPGPWQWLNGGDEHSDELQDGDGEEIARGFREDIEFTLNRDGSFAAATANYVRSLLRETKP